MAVAISRNGINKNDVAVRKMCRLRCKQTRGAQIEIEIRPSELDLLVGVLRVKQTSYSFTKMCFFFLPRLSRQTLCNRFVHAVFLMTLKFCSFSDNILLVSKSARNYSLLRTLKDALLKPGRISFEIFFWNPNSFPEQFLNRQRMPARRLDYFTFVLHVLHTTYQFTELHSKSFSIATIFC